MSPMPAPAPIPKSFQSKPLELVGRYVYWSCPAAIVRSKTSGIAAQIRQRGRLLCADRPLDDVRPGDVRLEPRGLAAVEHRGLLRPLQGHDRVDGVVLALEPRALATGHAANAPATTPCRRGGGWCEWNRTSSTSWSRRPGAVAAHLTAARFETSRTAEAALKCGDRVDRVVLALEAGVGLRERERERRTRLPRRPVRRGGG